MNVLVLDAGSSSLKFRLVAVRDTAASTLLNGQVESIGTIWARLSISREGDEKPKTRPLAANRPADAASAAFDALAAEPTFSIDAIGHRVVHGGAKFTAPTRLTPAVLAAIRELSPLAPLHNPVAADVIDTALRRLPNVPNVAVFDTAFHSTLPEIARRYALPVDLADRLGLRRFGFHGISHQVVSRRLLERMGREPVGTRVVTCHLGNGASLCAVREGLSFDTSMGLTPLEGLVMGTRSGDVDPGLVLYLLTLKGWSRKRVERLLNEESGLLGLSGTSFDVRELERAAAAGDARAELALDLFAYRVRKYLGAYAAALGGLDGVAFTGGIGEHSAPIRERVCSGLGFLGLVLSAERNRAANGDAEVEIGGPSSSVSVWVIPTDEEGEIARQTADLFSRAPSLHARSAR